MLRASVALLWMWSQMLTGEVRSGGKEDAPSPSLSYDIVGDHALSAAEMSAVEGAYRRALVVLLSDARDPESPLALAEALELPPGKSREDAARALLTEHLQRPSSSIRLCLDRATGLPLPEQEVDFERQWVFLLDMPSFADHYFWIVVDKDEEQAAAVYGFN